MVLKKKEKRGTRTQQTFREGDRRMPSSSRQKPEEAFTVQTMGKKAPPTVYKATNCAPKKRKLVETKVKNQEQHLLHNINITTVKIFYLNRHICELQI